MASKNGNGQQAVAARVYPKDIPSRIRSSVNAAFESWASSDSSGDPVFSERVMAAKKEVLAYMNGLRKNQKPAG